MTCFVHVLPDSGKPNKTTYAQKIGVRLDTGFFLLCIRIAKLVAKLYTQVSIIISGHVTFSAKSTQKCAINHVKHTKVTVFTRTVTAATITFVPACEWLLIKGGTYLRVATIARANIHAQYVPYSG